MGLLRGGVKFDGASADSESSVQGWRHGATVTVTVTLAAPSAQVALQFAPGPRR